MTHHARERCQEMGVSTKAAKRVVQEPTTTWTSDGQTVATSDEYPEITVVFAVDADGRPVVITVLYRTAEEYDRATFQPT
jgi:hypothetical protein